MSIHISSLSKQYGSQKAVDQLSFTVQRGEIVGFLGPNGAGKSTTMKMITGYLQPDSGQIEVCGLDVAAEPLETKKKIGYLPEANPLYLDMYVREYLYFMADVHRVASPKARVEEVIRITGLTPESHKKIGQLSKGYKQRVGLAAALIHDPEVLILDEPTSGLDPNQIMEIRDVIRTLGQQKTILFSSHILQEVEALCDRVIIINKGKLMADDRLSALRSGGENDRRVFVSFREPLEPAWMERLAAVRNIRRIDPQNWELEGDDVNEVRKQVLEMALQNNLNILSLQSGSSSLEDIFRTLTAPATNGNA